MVRHRITQRLRHLITQVTAVPVYNKDCVIMS